MSLSEISGSGIELSSRHIPDMDTLSSTSFSFQIPGTTTADNLLADEDENDFFRNAGEAAVSLALTHASPFSPAQTSPACIVQRKEVEDPILAQEDIRSSTPGRIADPPIFSPMDNLNYQPTNQRPKLSLNIRPLIQTVHTSPQTSFPPPQELPISTANDRTEFNHPLLKLKHTAIQLPDESESKARPTKKKVETKAKEQQGRKKDLLGTQRKIVEGGIAKSRIATSKKTREVPSQAAASSTLPPGSNQPSAPSLPVLTEDSGAEALLPDSSSSSIFPMTGIAGRLIQYGNKYIDSFSGQIDANVPTEKPTATLDRPLNPTIQGPSIQKTTQEREEPSSISVFPMKDSLIQHRRKYTATYLEKIGTNDSTEKVPLGFDLQSGPVNHGASVVQTVTQERNEDEPDEDDDPSKPLTLSQLSPRKQRTQDNVISPMPVTTSGTNLSPPPPVRPATKRPIATESASEEPKLKKSKSDDEHKTKDRPSKPTVSKRKPNSKPYMQSGLSQPQSRKPSTTRTTSGSITSLKKSDSSVTAAAPKPTGIRRTKNRIVSSGKQAAVFNPGTGWNDNVRLSDEQDMQRSNSSSKLSGSGLQNSRIQNESKQDDKAPLSSLSLMANGNKGAPRTTESITEESDSRSTSRSHSNSQPYKHKFYHPAPNFRAIHAAFDASVAQRKENIHPTVPLPMRWETDSRMQERKKFEERVREKEREKGKEEEERRRLRDAEEERGLKELRKKMVVRAHEVPEWYNDRPKTKRRQEQDVEN